MDGKLIWAAFFLIMNIAGILLMRDDKQRAKKHQYRIPEKTLWLTAILGGAVGTTVGMQLFRHKTKHLSFKVGFSVLAFIEIILFFYLILSF